MQQQEIGETLPLPVLVQPDPMLQEQAGSFRTILTGLGGALVVVLVLYGLSRPPEPQVMASAPEASAQSQTNAPPATTGSGQQEPQQNAKSGDKAGAKADAKSGAQPSTTGQGEPSKGQPNQGQAGATAQPGSATIGKAPAGPSGRPQPAK
jgi:hypothetical protein